MKRNDKLKEACQQAKISYMTKKLKEAPDVKYAIWVKSKDGKWRPWGGRTEYPSEEAINEMKDWFLDRGYIDFTITKNGARPVAGMVEDFEDEHVGASSEKEAIEDTPDSPTKLDEFSVATVINNLIQDEWQAIQGYNDALATVASLTTDESILNIFKDIAAEENAHVGQLQKALSIVSPNTAKIAEGEAEGSEQLAAPNESGVEIPKE